MLKYFLSSPAVKNQATGNFILHAKGKEAKTQVFIEMGLEWEYTVEDGKESLKTSGPLHEAISVLVSVAVFRAHLITLEVVMGLVSPTLECTVPCGHCSLHFFSDGLLFPSLSSIITPFSPSHSLPAGHPSRGGGGQEQPDVQVHHPRGPAAHDWKQQCPAGGDGFLRVGPQELVPVLQGLRRRYLSLHHSLQCVFGRVLGYVRQHGSLWQHLWLGNMQMLV